MEKFGGTEIRSVNHGDFQRLMTSPYDNGDSFTALLEMPSDQAMELLHSAEIGGDVLTRHRISACNHAPYALPSEQETEVIHSSDTGGDVLTRHRISACNHALYSLPSDKSLIERAAKYSVFAAEVKPELLNSVRVKPEPYDNGSNIESTAVSECENSLKRKEREKKGKNSSKKSKTTANQSSDDGEKLPYVHVRARRGQATDSHSLAERARREKINARMKLLQELVPGCNKISGTALVLDEIINHVQSLQRQVEYLSMRLAAVNPTFDSNLDSLISAGTESMIDYNYNLTNMAMPLMLPDLHLNSDRQQFQQHSDFVSVTQPPMWIKEENHHYLATSENSLVSYDSSANSASLHSHQLKMEL